MLRSNVQLTVVTSRILRSDTMTRITLLLCLFCAGHLAVAAQPCFGDLLPIGETDLLEPQDRWPEGIDLADSTRSAVLQSIGFVDTTGAPLSRVDVTEIHRCAAESGIEYVLYYLNGHADEHDDYVYVTTQRDGTILFRVLIAQLQTTCEFTYLRACTLRTDGGLLLHQLEHRFDCSSQEFLRTDVLRSIAVDLRSDGSFNETVLEPPTTDEP